MHRVLPKVSWDCRWTLNLPEGQLMVQGPFFDQANSVLAIVGGTGQYGAVPATCSSITSFPMTAATSSSTAWA